MNLQDMCEWYPPLQLVVNQRDKAQTQLKHYWLEHIDKFVREHPSQVVDLVATPCDFLNLGTGESAPLIFEEFYKSEGDYKKNSHHGIGSGAHECHRIPTRYSLPYNLFRLFKRRH